MCEYRLTPRAEQGLLRIAHHVEECFGSAITDRAVASIEAALVRLGVMPDTGHRRPANTVDDTIRFWSVGQALSAYRHD